MSLRNPDSIWYAGRWRTPEAIERKRTFYRERQRARRLAMQNSQHDHRQRSDAAGSKATTSNEAPKEPKYQHADQPDGVLWEDPLPEPTRTPWPEGLTDACREEPGKFALLRVYRTKAAASSFASMLRTGKKPELVPPGQWEFKAGGQPRPDGTCGVHVRFTGD